VSIHQIEHVLTPFVRVDFSRSSVSLRSKSKKAPH
jgi:hypothetical protein